MYDLATIEKMERAEARRSRQAGKIPLFIETEADKTNLNKIPNLGSYTPKNWEKTSKQYFVDSSGFGSVGELALTFAQFVRQVELGYGYAIISAGQFQVYVAQYKYKG